MRKVIYVLVVFFIIAIAAFATKPSNEFCIVQGSTAVREYSSSNRNSNFMFANQLNNGAFEQAVSVEDKVVFKTIRLKHEGKSTNIGWGAFGLVKLYITR